LELDGEGEGEGDKGTNDVEGARLVSGVVEEEVVAAKEEEAIVSES
jgi:hypothetical protein